MTLIERAQALSHRNYKEKKNDFFNFGNEQTRSVGKSKRKKGALKLSTTLKIIKVFHNLSLFISKTALVSEVALIDAQDELNIERALIGRPLFTRRADDHRSGAFLCNLHKFASFFLQNFVTFAY